MDRVPVCFNNNLKYFMKSLNSVYQLKARYFPMIYKHDGNLYFVKIVASYSTPVWDLHFKNMKVKR